VNIAAVNIGLPASDVSVQASINVPAVGGAHEGVIARYSGPGDSNLYLGMITFNGQTGAWNASIQRNLNGVYTALAIDSVATGTAVLKLEVVGRLLRLSLNGVVVVSALDSATLPAGTVGFRTSAGLSVDNFSADLLVQPANTPIQAPFTGPDTTKLA